MYVRQQGSMRGDALSRERTRGRMRADIKCAWSACRFRIQVDCSLVAGDEQATQQFDMVFSASSDSYDVRVSLGIFRRFRTGGAFVFDVNVLDMYPGLAEEEALIGSRQYRSSFNTLRISFVDNHLRPHTSHTDQTKNARNKRTGTMDVGKRAGVSIRMEPRDGATLVSGATIPVSISVHNKAASTCQDLEVRITMVGESAHLQLQRRLLLVPPHQNSGIVDAVVV